MAFSSQLYPGEVVIDDGTPEREYVPFAHQSSITDYSTGLQLPRGHSLEGGNYEGLAERLPSELLIDESEWQARIQEMEERKTRLSDLMNMHSLPEKDQDGIPYCWIFGPVQCVEVVRMLQGQRYVSLSPASAGAPIKGFRKIGGWGKEGLQWIADKGLVPTEFWPDCAVNRSYYTEENKQRALKYRVTEWWELKPRSLKEQISLLLRRVPGAGGRNYWSHETMDVEPVWLDGTVAIRGRNQWKGYGDKNFFILRGNKMLADDLVAPRVATSL